MCVFQVRYVDQGLVENIPVCHVYPTVLCEDIPQLCMPCQLHGVIPVSGLDSESWCLCSIAVASSPLSTVAPPSPHSVQVGRTWQWDAVALLKELLLNRCVDMQVMVRWILHTQRWYVSAWGI